jgi:hypothetical protein
MRRRRILKWAKWASTLAAVLAVGSACHSGSGTHSKPDSAPQAAVQVVPLDPKNYGQIDDAVRQAVQVYPFDVLSALDLHVVPVAELRVSDRRCSGQIDDHELYVAVPDLPPLLQKVEVQSTINHELAHAILDRFRGRFQKDKWSKLLPEGFTYGTTHRRPSPGGESAWVMTDLLDGFLRDECRGSMDEDFAEIAEELFRNRPIFWIAVSISPRLKAKAMMVIEFYGELHPAFTVEWFRSLRPVQSD